MLKTFSGFELLDLSAWAARTKLSRMRLISLLQLPVAHPGRIQSDTEYGRNHFVVMYSCPCKNRYISCKSERQFYGTDIIKLVMIT